MNISSLMRSEPHDYVHYILAKLLNSEQEPCKHVQ